MRNLSLATLVAALAALPIPAPAPAAVVIYREIFPNDSGADRALGSAQSGWEAYTSYLHPGGYRISHFSAHSLGVSTYPGASNVAGLPPVNSNPAFMPINGTGGFLYDVSWSGNQPLREMFMYWTDEYTLDPGLWEIATFSVAVRHTSANDPDHLVVRVGEQWYYSDQANVSGGIGNWVTNTWNYSEANWLLLDFAPTYSTQWDDSPTFAMTGTAATLPEGPVTAFGVLHASRTDRLRYDDFTITATPLGSVDGEWVATADGNWADAANWSGGLLADGSSATATFNVDVPAGGLTVTIDAANPIGHLTFGDTDRSIAGSWIVSGNALTLHGASPTITVGPLGSGAAVTISAPLDGTHGLVKAGEGTLVLTAENTYSGGTTISEGTLQIGDGGTTGTLGWGPLVNHGTLVFNLANDRTVHTTVSGSGSLTKRGTGTLTLASATTYAGPTTIEAGTLQIGSNDGAGVGAPGHHYRVAEGAQLVFQRNLFVTDFTSQSISGAGDVVFRGQRDGLYRFRSDYTGALTYTGKTIVDLDAGTTWDRGVLWLETENVLPDATVVDLRAGKIYLRNQTGAGLTIGGLEGNAGTLVTARLPGEKLTIDVAEGQVYTYEGTIGMDTASGVDGRSSDGLSLTKAGPGTQVLAGTNTYTGGTTIAGGTLVVTGSLASGGPITVRADGRLVASGTIGGLVSICPGGVFAPGRSVGTLKVDGDLAFHNGAFFDIEMEEVEGAGRSDRVQMAGGTLTPGNATIRVHLLDGFNPDYDAFWTILENESFIDGTFNPDVLVWDERASTYAASFDDGAKWFEVHYGNSVSLKVVPEPATLMMAAMGLAGLLLLRRRAIS